jgi:hypothetical protein
MAGGRGLLIDTPRPSPTDHTHKKNIFVFSYLLERAGVQVRAICSSRSRLLVCSLHQ